MLATFTSTKSVASSSGRDALGGAVKSHAARGRGTAAAFASRTRWAARSAKDAEGYSLRLPTPLRRGSGVGREFPCLERCTDIVYIFLEIFVRYKADAAKTPPPRNLEEGPRRDSTR